MKNILSFLIFFTVLSNVSAQTNFNRFDYWFGDPYYVLHTYQSVSRLGSNLYCTIGVVDSSHVQYLEIVKLNSIGNLEKKTKVKDTIYSIGCYPGHSIIVDRDSNIIVCAFKLSNITNNWDGFIVKVNQNMDTFWTRTYQMPTSIAGCTSGQDPVNFFTSIKEDPKGGYIVAGNYLVNCVSGSIGLYLTKYDTAGNLIWVRTYPGIEGVYDFEITNDGSFYIGSKMNTTPKLIKIDENGIYQWNITTYSASNSSWPLEVEIMDSNYLIVSSRFRYDFNMQLDGLKVSKINYKTKQQIWSKDFYLFYNFRDPDLNQYAKLRILPNKDILVAGTSQVFAWDSLTGGYKGILFRLNQNGDSLWTRYYHTTQSFNDDDVFCDVELMDDGGFLAVGYHKPWVENLNWAAWMVRTDSLGNAPMDGSASVESGKLKVESCWMKVYPNPANNYLTIEYKTASKNFKELSMELRDTQGKLIFSQILKGGDNEEIIGIKDLAPGIYTTILYADKMIVETKKLTVINK